MNEGLGELRVSQTLFYTYKKNECSNKLYTNRWKCVIFLKDIYLYIPIEITSYYGVGKLISMKFLL